MPLPSIFHVLNFPLTLLSVGCLPKTMNCSVTFFPSMFFKIWRWRRWLVEAMRLRGSISLIVLHMLLSLFSRHCLYVMILLLFSKLSYIRSVTLQIWLLVIFSFEKGFPNLLTSLSDSDHHCETCEYAKHCRVPYHVSSICSTIAFSIVHSDVWGQLLLFPYLASDTLLPLLMTTLELYGSIYWNLKAIYS